ncbi:hypothetical protein [Streptomyces lunaelactis]|uniref:hypothetical protein n=1 Tax=Streptomyces lunaelactis TaxID=1535768 RepID=UPI0015854D37|nr:hypothetical protein [Streptomyces lunaelactis]NUK26893.1 hypothetical protein [Streptomyces lunaelactis]
MVRLKDTSKVKSRTRKVGAAVTAAASVAGMVFAATPATATVAAASTFSVKYTVSYYNGTATWSNRSVDVNGSFKASNCRRVYVQAFAGSTSLDEKNTSTWCNRSGPLHFPPLDANVVGGSDNIWVYMTDGDQNYLAGQTCYRSGYCIDGLH